MIERFPITRNGYEKLKKEIENLKNKERPNVIRAIATAREHGDLSENAEYKAAKENQSFVEGRIKDLESKLSRAEIIDIEKMSDKTVKFGAAVTIVDCDTEEEMTYYIVGEYEADASRNLISVSAPLAKALIGKEIGDEAKLIAPSKTKFYEITNIEYKNLDA